MIPLSVVIVCRNEETDIGRCISSVKDLTDDIVVLDNGSTDRTKEIVVKSGARLIEAEWEGFGKTKGKATALAKYDWVLNLDADENPDDELKSSIRSLGFQNPLEVFEICFKNFFGARYLRFGEWGGDKHIRLFNRQQVQWNTANVHEGLRFPAGVIITRLKGYILHYTVKTKEEFAAKMLKYGTLTAEKYAEMGKRSSWLRVRISPVFSFVKNYFFKLGFLDGEAGLICARMNSYYTRVKYARLLELNRQNE